MKTLKENTPFRLLRVDLRCAVAACFVMLWLLLATASLAAEETEGLKLQDKTLVAWVRLGNLDQQGSGILSVSEGRHFDAITFGERVSCRWMSGSTCFDRTQADASQNQLPPEISSPEQTICIAIVYRGNQIEIWRNGSLYTSYAAKGQHAFSGSFDLLLGARCQDGDEVPGHLIGVIEEVRLYDSALDKEVITNLKPMVSGIPSEAHPLGLWTFDGGEIKDLAGNFPDGRLVGNAKIVDGQLCLSGNGYAIIEASNKSQTSCVPAVGFGKAISPFFLPRGVKSGDTFPFYTKGRWHLFSMSEGCFAHSSSDDLVHWKQHPGTPFKGATGTVVEHDGRYYMFFTNSDQSIFLAQSDDLDTWKLCDKNPILKSDGKIYQHGNFRDPYVFYNEGEQSWWMLIGAREVGVAGQRSGCIGLAKSKDLENWTLHPPLWAPRIGPHTDCPQLLKQNDQWYLFYLQRFTRYRTSSSLKGPWERGTRRNLNSRLASAGSRAASDGKRWISWPFLVTFSKEDEFSAWGYGGPLAVPREWVFGDNGTIGVRPPQEIVQAMHQAKPNGRNLLDDTKVLTGDWEISKEKHSVKSQSNSGGSLLLRQIPENFYFEADVVLDCEHMDARLLFNTNENLTEGYILSLMPDENRVILRGTSYWDVDRELVQNPVPLRPNRPIKLRVFRTGSVVDIFIDDHASVTHRLFRFSGGDIALEFTDGTGRFENLFLCELPKLCL